MYQLFLIISLIVCVLLVLIVLIQNPKGGGLTSNFSGSAQLMGVKKTGDFLEKGTWGLAIALMVLSLIINVAVKGGTEKSVNAHEDAVKSSLKTTPTAPPPASAPLNLSGQQGTATPSATTPATSAPAKKK